MKEEIADKLAQVEDGDLMTEVRDRYAEGDLKDDEFNFIGPRHRGLYLPSEGAILNGLEPDGSALDEAAARWRRGEKQEALHYLELGLGRDFSGLGDLRPEDLR